MRRAVGVFLFVALAVRPAAAGRMLIATAATEGGLDRFCLHPNGSFVSRDSRESIALRRQSPRKMIFVAEDRPGNPDAGVLYVGHDDRVEAIRFDRDGNVARHCGDSGTQACRGQTEVANSLEARGLAVDPVSRTLYVSQHGLDRITAYQLDDNGLPPEPEIEGVRPFASCVQGKLSSAYADVFFDEGSRLLYAAAEAGRIDVFGTLPDGRLCSCAPCQPEGDGDCEHKETCAATDECKATTAAECPEGQNFGGTPPLLQRRKLTDPTNVFVLDSMMIVQEAPLHRLVAFSVADLQPVTARTCNGGENAGQPCTAANEADACPNSYCATPPKVCVAGVNIGKACKNKTEDVDCPGSTCGDVAPKRTSRTDPLERYTQMIRVTGTDTLIGSQFVLGRLDAFRLKAPGKSNCKVDLCPEDDPLCCLPRTPSSRSKEDLRVSPVGLTAVRLHEDAPDDGYLLYVAGGTADRVLAFRLYPKGLFRTTEPFDKTNRRQGSYPNAVAIAPSDSCP